MLGSFYIFTDTGFIPLQLWVRATTCFRPSTTIVIEGYSFILIYNLLVVLIASDLVCSFLQIISVLNQVSIV